MRGTVNNTNWTLNKDTRGVRDRKVGIVLHSGFRTAAQVIYRDVKPRLKRGYTTYLTGHSLGGAVAGILGIYLRHDRYRLGGIFTFGQPKFTNVAGDKAYRKLPLLRVVNQNDTVALLPERTKQSGQTFAHIGPVVNLLSGPHYFYGNVQEALEFSQGSFGKLLGQISVPDHAMRRYVNNLRGKLNGTKRVSFENRNKYIVRKRRGTAGANSGPPVKRTYNFNTRN